MAQSVGGKKMAYGGDYNPEQWDESVWEEDMRLFHQAHIDLVTLNVFSWAALQPDENTYCFDRLDKILNLARENGLRVCLATSTGAHPAWMAKRHPDVLRTRFDGIQRKFGFRHNSCPNSPTYRKYSALLAGKLAERYREMGHIAAWHVSNEMGGECYCENCEKAFRVWLKKRYGTLDELNRVWNTSFWGHTFYDWDEIVLPNLLSEHLDENRTVFQGISLDYRRFNSESILECYRAEYEAIKRFTPDIPVTTNFMGLYKPLNYQEWAPYMDFISWDNYPANEDPPENIALSHDLMRGLKHGQPFVLMEQTPSVTNWQPYNALKRPGVMRLWSYQAVAHGADAVLFFQMRRSVGASEKLHGAVIDHAGRSDTRVFREVEALGAELEKIGDLTLGAVTDAQAAILFDWENWWAVEYSAGPSRDLHYLDEILKYYSAFHRKNIPVDLVAPGDDLSRYRVVVAPVLYMVKTGFDKKLRAFVKNGGTLIATFFSGIVDEHDLVVPGGYPGYLRDILGIWVEETDALPPQAKNSFSYKGKRYPVRLLCDLLHPEGAQPLAVYEQDFYAGMPALTCNAFGVGKAYYVATGSDDAFYDDFLGEVCGASGVQSVMPAQSGLEATRRHNENGSFLFLLNHGEEARTVLLNSPCKSLLTGEELPAGTVRSIPPKGVEILWERRP